MARENAHDSDAANTSSSHQNIPRDVSAQVKQRCGEGRREEEDVPPPSPIHHAFEQVGCRTSHSESQFNATCLLFHFLSVSLPFDDVFDYNLRASLCFLQVVSEVLFPTRDSSPAQRTPVLSHSLPRPASTPQQSVVSSDVLKSVDVISQLLRETEGELLESRNVR